MIKSVVYQVQWKGDDHWWDHGPILKKREAAMATVRRKQNVHGRVAWRVVKITREVMFP